MILELESSQLHVQLINWSPTPDSAVLVFLHDALGSVAQWRDFPSQLSEKTSLPAVVYDRHGHGQSPPFLQPRERDYLHREATQILPQLLKKLAIQHPILIGHSDGGTIALIYAAFHTAEAIITLAAHIDVESVTTAGIRQALNSAPVLLSKLRKYHGEKAGPLFAAWHRIWLSDSFADWSIEIETELINCPALIMQGERDEYATQRHAGRIVSIIGDRAELAIQQDCGHMLHLECGSAVLAKIVTFINSYRKTISSQ